jgi:hypothetical protein
VLLPPEVDYAQLEVYNVLGQFVASLQVQASQSQISVMDWNKGAYLIKLILPSGQVQSFKLIKA